MDGRYAASKDCRIEEEEERMNEIGFKVSYKNELFKRRIQEKFSHITGASHYKTQIDTLYYFLNKYLDIRSLPPAQGNVRELQLCDSILLRIFDSICNTYNLTYWIDAGTLLGAVRHSGFIPWDDDLDVLMPRRHFEDAIEILRAELPQYHLELRLFDRLGLTYIGIGYDHENTGVWLDIFPADVCYTDDSQELFQKKLLRAAKKYGKYFSKKKSTDSEIKLLQKKQYFFRNFQNGKNKYYWLAPEFNFPVVKVANADVIFPVEKVGFEGSLFPAPNDTDSYLTIAYGHDYASFPRSGVEHHGNSTDRLSDRASRKMVDLKRVKEELLSVFESITLRVFS